MGRVRNSAGRVGNPRLIAKHSSPTFSRTVQYSLIEEKFDAEEHENNEDINDYKDDYSYHGEKEDEEWQVTFTW